MKYSFTQNRYTYCFQNSLNFVDLDGAWVGYNDFEVLNLVFEIKNRNNKKYYQCMMIESQRLQDKVSPNNDYYKMKAKFLKGVLDFIPNIKVVERKNYVECEEVEIHLIEANGKEYIVEYSKVY